MIDIKIPKINWDKISFFTTVSYSYLHTTTSIKGKEYLIGCSDKTYLVRDDMRVIATLFPVWWMNR